MDTILKPPRRLEKGPTFFVAQKLDVAPKIPNLLIKIILLTIVVW